MVDRVGEIHTSKDGDEYKIIEYNYYTSIVVEFLETGNQYESSYKKVKDNTVRDKDKYRIPTVDHNFNPNLCFEENIDLLYEMFKGRTTKEAIAATEGFLCALLEHYKGDKKLFYKFVDLAYDQRTENKYFFVFSSVAKKLKPPSNYVYLLMKDGDIVYVGKSTRITSRLNDHRQENQKDFDSVMIKEVETEYEMDVLENSLIYKLKPKYNKTVRMDYVADHPDTADFVNFKDYSPLVIYEKTTLEEFRFDITTNYVGYGGYFIRKDVLSPNTVNRLSWRDSNYVKPEKSAGRKRRWKL